MIGGLHEVKYDARGFLVERHNYSFTYSPDGKLLETRERLDSDWFSRTASRLFPSNKRLNLASLSDSGIVNLDFFSFFFTKIKIAKK